MILKNVIMWQWPAKVFIVFKLYYALSYYKLQASIHKKVLPPPQHYAAITIVCCGDFVFMLIGSACFPPSSARLGCIALSNISISMKGHSTVLAFLLVQQILFVIVMWQIIETLKWCTHKTIWSWLFEICLSCRVIFELLWRDYFKFVGIKYGNKMFQVKGNVRKCSICY